MQIDSNWRLPDPQIAQLVDAIRDSAKNKDAFWQVALGAGAAILASVIAGTFAAAVSRRDRTAQFKAEQLSVKRAKFERAASLANRAVDYERRAFQHYLDHPLESQGRFLRRVRAYNMEFTLLVRLYAPSATSAVFRFDAALSRERAKLMEIENKRFVTGRILSAQVLELRDLLDDLELRAADIGEMLREQLINETIATEHSFYLWARKKPQKHIPPAALQEFRDKSDTAYGAPVPAQGRCYITLKEPIVVQFVHETIYLCMVRKDPSPDKLFWQIECGFVSKTMRVYNLDDLRDRKAFEREVVSFMAPFIEARRTPGPAEKPRVEMLIRDIDDVIARSGSGVWQDVDRAKSMHERVDELTKRALWEFWRWQTINEICLANIKLRVETGTCLTPDVEAKVVTTLTDLKLVMRIILSDPAAAVAAGHADPKSR